MKNRYKRKVRQLILFTDCYAILGVLMLRIKRLLKTKCSSRYDSLHSPRLIFFYRILILLE